MIRLASFLYPLISTTLAGSAVITALVMGHDTSVAILVAAGIGFVAGLPASYLVAKRMA